MALFGIIKTKSEIEAERQLVIELRKKEAEQLRLQEEKVRLEELHQEQLEKAKKRASKETDVFTIIRNLIEKSDDTIIHIQLADDVNLYLKGSNMFIDENYDIHLTVNERYQETSRHTGTTYNRTATHTRQLNIYNLRGVDVIENTPLYENICLNGVNYTVNHETPFTPNLSHIIDIPMTNNDGLYERELPNLIEYIKKDTF